MWPYLIRRLILLPTTLFFIVLINFAIINLAPGDPVSQVEISNQGATKSQGGALAFGSDDRYLQFREFFGLTLPIVFNTWPNTEESTIIGMLAQIDEYMKPGGKKLIKAKEFHDTRIKMGDMARFVMPKLLQIMDDKNLSKNIRATASQFFVRGGTKMAFLGPALTLKEKQFNEKIVADNYFFKETVPQETDDAETFNKKITLLKHWYEVNKDIFHFELTPREKISAFFFETRFF